MINQLFSLIFMTIAGTAQGIALEYMLQVNNKRCSRNFRLVYWTALALIPSMINIFGPPVTSTIILRQFLHWSMAIIAMIVFYLDPIWRRIIAIILVFLGMTCSDFIFLFTFSITGQGIGFFADKTNPITMLFVAIGMVLAIIFIFLIAFIWRRFLHRKEKIRYLSVFIIYMLNHFLTFLIMEKELWSMDLHQTEIIPALTGYICEMVLIIIIFSQSEKENMENSLNTEKQKNELEKYHFEELKKRRDSLIELSQQNDYEIKLIQQQIKDNNFVEAERKLRHLLHKVEETKENPYCEIHIINAILSDKKRMCDANKIQTNINIDLPMELSINKIDLCSAFSNLMDNAIRACSKTNSQNEEAIINLNAVMNGEYLVIVCCNSSNRVSNEMPEGTGLGLKILKDITNRYEGNLKTEFNEDHFSVKLILRVPGSN